MSRKRKGSIVQSLSLLVKHGKEVWRRKYRRRHEGADPCHRLLRVESLENRNLLAGLLGDASIFDLDLFEQNVRNTFTGNAVGFSYAINQDGSTVRRDGLGDARTDDLDTINIDEQLDFTADTRMTIASVAKTITATGILKILQDTSGVHVDSLISPYLPTGWVQGPFINTITFRELLTHHSGLRAQDWDGSSANDPNDGDTGPSLNEQTTFAGLQLLIASGIPDPSDPTVNLKDDFSYQNANFALMRVMTAYLLGDGASADSAADPAQFTADAYVQYVSSEVLAPMGIVDADTKRGEDDEILNYPFPNPNATGFSYDDRTLLAGGEGWWLSSDELALFLIGVRSNDDVLSPTTREMMRDGFLGWQDPGHDYAFANSMFGADLPYYVHGGSLSQLETCIFDFPNAVQISLLVNSNIGPNVPHAAAYNTSPSKHELLKRAYENAWPEFAVAGTAGPDQIEILRNPLDDRSVDIFLNDELIVTRWTETLEKLTLTGLDGNDTFYVDGLPDNIEIELLGGAENDIFHVADYDIGLVGGDVTVDGGSGSDSLEFNEGWVLGDATYIITNGTTAKSTRVGQVHYKRLEELTVYGGNGDDSMYVYATDAGPSVRVLGLAGNDLLVGGPAADWLSGGEDNDTIQGAAGNDTIYAGAGNDFIGGGSENDLILCGDGNDIASGDDGQDIVVGEAGADLLAGGEGHDTVTGGDDNDTLVGGWFSAGPIVTEEMGNDTIDGGDGNDRIYGDSWALGFPQYMGLFGGNDTIQGNLGDDTIYGQAGNDFIGGWLGDDEIWGGMGDDVVSGDHGDDQVHGEAHNDLLAGGEGNDSVFGGNGDDILVGGWYSARLTVIDEVGDDDLDGGEGDDLLFGDSWAMGAPLNMGLLGGNDTMQGGPGNDLIYGQAGNDFIGGGLDDDKIWGGEGNDIASGDWGDDSLAGEAGNDTLAGGSNNDSLIGGIGNDIVVGGWFSAGLLAADEMGNDSLQGNDGDDWMFGDSWALGAPDKFGVIGGNDHLRGGLGNDLLVGQSGDDTLVGDEGNDTLLGSLGHDRIRGGSDNDNLYGDSGNDVLLGESGNDNLNGGFGRDLLIGGLGSDSLEAGADDDILISGTTTHDANDVALGLIMAEWTSDRSYQARVKNLRGISRRNPDFDDRLNGSVFLINRGSGATVMNDNSYDSLTGSGGLDWFMLDHLSDQLVDREPFEVWR